MDRSKEKGTISIIVTIMAIAVLIGVAYGSFRYFGSRIGLSSKDKKSSGLTGQADEESDVRVINEEQEAPRETLLPASELSASQEGIGSQQALEVNFSETGTILNWDSRTETFTEDWSFLYEKPGSPAISVKLIFNEGSLCDGVVCNKGKLNNGERVKLEGNNQGGQVTVLELEKI